LFDEGEGLGSLLLFSVKIENNLLTGSKIGRTVLIRRQDQSRTETKMEDQTIRCPEDDMSGEELEAYYAKLWQEEVELMELTQKIDEQFEKELNEIFPERW
jgi:hypothetical protein